jgi:ornithine cyclodeaminase/alanine dehydrogenase
MRILSEADVASLLDFDLAVACADEAFRLLSAGTARNGGRQRVEKGATTLNLMGAVAPTIGAMGAKVYPVVRSDVSQGASFLYQLYSSETGALRAILSANVLGNRRTAAATAVATRTLARPESASLTVVGAGWVAMEQLAAVLVTMPGIRSVSVVGRDPRRLDDFVRRAGARFRDRDGLTVAAVGVAEADAERAIAAADILITATGSASPVLDGRWISPGTHLNAVGSNYASKRELDDTAIERADLVVVDSLDVARSECGDLMQFSGGFPGSAIELGAVLLGSAAGRTGDSQVTLFESQGMAILDLVAAHAVVTLAEERGVGVELGSAFEAWPVDSRSFDSAEVQVR